MQARICQVCPQARYIHCFAHRLNLVLVDSSQTVIVMRDFFSVLQMLYLFLSSSAVLPVFEGAQKQKGKTKPIHLKLLSDTRWTCRFDSVNSVMKTIGEVILTLEHLYTKDSDSKRRIEAGGLLVQVRSFKFIFVMVLSAKMLAIAKGLVRSTSR